MANVKTAVSLEEELFTQVEQLAREMHISRSRLFALALEEFVQRYENRRLLEQINTTYGEEPDEEEVAWRQAVREHQRRLMEREP